MKPPRTGECRATGCGGSVCSNDVIYTTCEEQPEYECYRLHGKCGRFGKDGKCAWQESDALKNCTDYRLHVVAYPTV